MKEQPLDQPHLRRAPVVAIYDTGDTTVVLGPDGSAHELQDDSAALAREVLHFFTATATEAELIAHLERLTAQPLSESTVVRELVSLLLGVGALRRVQPRSNAVAEGGEHSGETSTRAGGQRARVVLGLSGAVGTMHAPSHVQHLQAHGFEVRIMATEAAMQFVTATALEALVHDRVVTGMWSEDPAEVPVPHISLARWADAVVIWPASATTIGRLATGDYSSVVSAAALATDAPVLVVPSMNASMYSSPAVRRNVEQLIADGFHVAHPGTGPEVADTPLHRAPSLGASVPASVVRGLLETMLRRHGSARSSSGDLSAEQWDAMFRTREASDLPWHNERIDDDLAALLEELAPEPLSVLDVGTGLGTVAAACASRGHRVVAVDVSRAALARAHERTRDAAVVWLRDDITASRLQVTFDLIVDRGCVGLLPDVGAQRYAREIARLTAPGGVVVLKALAGEAASSRGATSHTDATIEALFAGGFTLERSAATTMPGPAGNEPAASLFVLRRY